jgi:hypothetical protein
MTAVSRPIQLTLNALSAVLLAAALLVPLCAGALAQTPVPPTGRSYLTAFPPGDRYQAIVIGDSLAQGLASGLEEAFRPDGNIRIANKAVASSGLARTDNYDWDLQIDDVLKDTPAQIVIVMVGLNDVRSIRNENGNIKFGMPEWRDAYGRQVDRLLKKFKALNVAVYWVGVPVMSNTATNDAMANINEVLRERTYLNGVRFADTWSGFADQFGNYSVNGPDLAGQMKKLREADGVSFTGSGNRKLAHYVEVLMRRDLTAARNERNIPLAGEDEEQARLVSGKPAAAEKPAGNAKAPVPPPPAKTAEHDNAAPAASSASGAKLYIAPGVDVAQLGASVGGTGGEMIPGSIDSGVTALASISPATDLGMHVSQNHGAADGLYNKVLIKGEYLPPKPGRADDFTWPKTQEQATEQQ